MFKRNPLAALGIIFVTFICSFQAWAAPGDIIESFAINNEAGDGRVPTTPQGIAYRNGYLWVTDFGTDRIYRVYPEDVLAEDGITVLYSAGDSDFNIPLDDNAGYTGDRCAAQTDNNGNPIGICGGGGLTFARNFLWNVSTVTDDIIKIDPDDGENMETENALASLVFPAPTDIAYDGTHFWILDWQQNNITRVHPEDGTELGTIPGPSSLPSFVSNPNVTNARPFGLTYDGQALWVSDRQDDMIYRVRTTDGAILDQFPSPGTNPYGLDWDGESLWHIDSSTRLIYRIDSGVIPFGVIGCIMKNGRGINGDVQLEQTATQDQNGVTDMDGCFHFPSFLSGVPMQITLSETGIDEKPIVTLTGGNVTLIVGEPYVELGYVATDTEDGVITSDVRAVPNVIDNPSLINTAVPGPAEGYQIEYYVVDEAGNRSDPVYRTVYVLEQDVVPPVITLNGANPMYVEQGGSYAEPGATVLDARDGDISGDVVITGSVNAAIAGTYTRTYNASDAAGNAATPVTRTVIVQDTTPPSITVNGANPMTLEKGSIFTDPGVTATDNINGNITANVIRTGTVSSNIVGSYILNYNVADAAGNYAPMVARRVDVIDTTPPVITLTGASTINHELNTAFTDPGASASDVLGDNLTGSIVVTGTVNTTIAGTYTLNYNVSDASGNAATTVTRSVVVADRSAPTIALVGANPLHHERGAVFTDPGATATDAVDGNLTASIVRTGTVNVNATGSYTLTYNVSDSAGNAATAITRTVNVSDTTPPSITLIGASTIQHPLGTPYTDAGATADDNIDGNITASIVTSGSVNANVAGNYFITYNVSDASGNGAAPVTRLIQVADRTAPVITLVGANPLNHEMNTVFVDPGATASDNVDGNISANVSVTGTVNAGVLGTYTLTYRVTDAAGNQATAVTRTVNVVDTGAPTITLIGANPILHQLQTTYTDPGATAVDAVDGDRTASIVRTGTVNANVAGTYTLTYNVSDLQGNAAPTVTRTVIVADRVAPVITLTGTSPMNVEQGSVFTDPGATASDVISGNLTASIVVTGSVNTAVAGTYTLTYNVSDTAGNAAAAVSRTVIVSDTTRPVITLVGASPLSHEINTVFLDPGATASDNIDGNISASVTVSGTVNAGVLGSYTLTYRVSDAAGNQALVVTRTVNVVDTGAPTITLLGSATVLHQLQTTYTDAGATATDAADGNRTSSIVVTGSVNANIAGTYTLTYNVSDTHGNAAAPVTRTVVVADRVPPVITLTGASTMNVAQGSTFTDPGATASDVISGNLTASIVVTGSVNTAVAGTYTLTYNVSDAAGNAATPVVRTVNVADTTRPVITLVGANPLTHEINTVFVDPGATATDNVDGDISSSVSVTGSVNAGVLGTYTLTYRVTDAAGNQALVVTRTVNVVDTGAPTITLLGSATVLHQLQTTYTDAGATASDASDGHLTGSIVVTGTVNANVAGTYTLTYNVTDSQGNAATAVTRTVNVADRVAPVITLTGTSTMNVAQGSTFTDPGATASDVISGNLTASIVVTGSVNTAVAGTYTLTYNVSDAAGNAATPVVRTVNVADTTRPVITLVGANPLTHEINTVFVDPGATATDNVDGDISSSVSVTGSVNAGVLGTYTLTYRVTDAAGNQALVVTRTVNVVDTGAPTITLLGSATVLHQLQTTYTDAGATASDASDGNLTSSIVVTGTVNANVAGTYTLTYNVTDSQGNAATAVTRTVNVADRVAPVITLTGTSTMNVAQGSTFTDPGATASDVISGNLTASIVVTGSVNTAVAGTYTLTYNVSDAAGNAATPVVRTVNVADTTRPVITLVGANPLTHEINTVFVDPGATATDNVDGNITAGISVSGSVNVSVLGTYTLTYRVTDAAGNQALVVTRTVNVVDTGAPTITLLGSATVLHQLQTTYTDAGATASDASDGNLTGSIVVTGTVNANVAGTYTLTYNVTDSQGNAATAVTRTVNVADRVAPVITLTGASPMHVEQGATFIDPGATATDVINGNLTASIVRTGSVNATVAGTYTLTYNVSDAAGNAAAPVTRIVNVSDTTRPIITLVGLATINHTAGTVYVDPGATASDNINGNITSRIGVSGSVNANVPGAYILSYNVTDLSGNAALTITRTINVTDTGAPVITITGANPLNHTINTAYVDPGATAFDTVDGNLTASITATGSVNANVAGTYQINYDVMDSNSNPAAQATRTVNVGDFMAPVITLLGNATVNHELGTAYTDAGATATDNMDGNLTSSILVSGSVDSMTSGTYVLSYNVVDNAGNNATQVTRTVTVRDSIVPTITLVGASTISHPVGTAFTDPGASASDNTDGNISANIVITGNVNTAVPGSYVLTYNVSDAAGNNAVTRTRTVNVVDNIAPVLTLTGASSVNHEQGTTYTDAGATATDNIDGNLTSSIVRTGTVNANAAGTYTLTYNVSDAGGNAATAVTRTVVVADTEPPVITLSGSNSINHQQNSAYADAGATAFDSVGGNLSSSIVVTGSVNANVPGTYILQYNVTDAAGNAAAPMTRSVTVRDMIPPVITLTGSSVVNHTVGNAYTDAGATANDNIDGNVTANIVLTGSVNVSVPGVYTLRYNVVDAAGNAATQVTRTVNVGDTTAPVITLTGASTMNITIGSAFTDPGATASDNVDGNITARIVVSGDTIDTNVPGTYSRHYDVTDNAGNAATRVTRIVWVRDGTAPVITLLGSSTVTHNLGQAYTDAGATATDNIDGNISASIVVSGSVNTSVPGTYILTFNVSDSAGNSAATVTRVVTVRDSIRPVIVLNGSASIDHRQGQAYTDAGATATDNIDGTITSRIAITSNVNINTAGTYTVRYNVADNAGNAATEVVRTVRVVNPTTITLQAESATRVGTFTAGDGLNDTGSGYIDIVNTNAGDYLQFTQTLFNLRYNLTIRYASLSDASPLEVILNGTSLGNVALPTSGGSYTYRNSTALSILPIAGSNVLRLRLNVNAGNKRIDSITLTPQ